MTAGGDGTYNFWDKDSKQRLKAMQKCQYGADPAPITCGAFNSDGSIYAYGVSYDWSRGFQSYNPSAMQPAILLHATQEAEVRRGAGLTCLRVDAWGLGWSCLCSCVLGLLAPLLLEVIALQLHRLRCFACGYGAISSVLHSLTGLRLARR